METNKEAIERIVNKRLSEIIKLLETQITYIKESSQREYGQVRPKLMSEIEAFTKLLTLNIIDLIECGGFIKTGLIDSESDYNYLNVEVNMPQYSGEAFGRYRLEKGRYRVVLIVEKLPEKEEEA